MNREPRKLRRICVFCGSSNGNDPVYAEAALKVGRLLARSGIAVVYGGGDIGLMGVVADAALDARGEVIGVIPHALVDRELAHHRLTKLHVVESMHERKALMADLSDAFILLPGGYGSLDEFCEAITWLQLGIHRKPCGILNVNGYYDSLIAQFDRSVEDGFVRRSHREVLVIETEPKALLDRLSDAPVIEEVKWIKDEER
ncbi:MAG TPA: TIGR00730 family Rossman fold protein [Blastocatellia bacterium]|nr:TIGR00730 family Rossman fold protein [Blastocatellia bacterium]